MKLWECLTKKGQILVTKILEKTTKNKQKEKETNKNVPKAIGKW